MPGHLLILKCNLNPNISLQAAHLAHRFSADRPLYRETHIPVTISNSGARIPASPPVVTCLRLLEIIHHPPALQAIILHQCPQEITRRQRALREIISNPTVLRLTIPHHPAHREYMANPHTTPHLVHQANTDMFLAHLNETLATPKVCCNPLCWRICANIMTDGPPMPPSQYQFYGPQMQGPNNQVQQPYFQYSQCTGKKRALCIGINYFNQPAQLAGCINDANNLKAFLMSHFGYREENIRVLTDDSPDPRRWPSRRNMLDHMQWLVHDAQPNDSFFFHYSGHGGQTEDLDGDEEDGYDEVIYPADHQTAGHIVDDLMHDIMVRPLPPGCRLTAIFDSCHSGTALGTIYPCYSTEGKIKEPNIAAEAGMGVLSAMTSYARGDVGGIFRSVTGLIKTASGSSKKAEQYARATKTSPADCISFSGCKDSQTSADTQMVNKATGAMSFAFVQAIKRNPRQSYQQLLVSIR
ncbi:caspase domain-containing protein [Pisolithus croceorrhizus]|nr:caspase domain-containing protein [Pisolithus croceorrhizus]